MEAPPVTMMPVTGGTINMMEYLLQGMGFCNVAQAGLELLDSSDLPASASKSAGIAGSVLDHSLESLIHRLRGLCDNMEPETFLDHEMVFLLKGQQASPFVLRARRSMDRAGAPWHLRYLGQPEMGDKNRHALVRNCVDIATSENLTDFLMEMGFRMDHEFVAKGHLFRKGIMKIMVYKIFRILVPGNTDSTEALSLSYLVELSVVAPAGQDMVSDDMRNFAEQLKPLVHLEKIDPKRLM
ncbi:Mediator of RNA polymerase II transcription subunit 18 [Plecturocebus cupreus]